MFAIENMVDLLAKKEVTPRVSKTNPFKGKNVLSVLEVPAGSTKRNFKLTAAACDLMGLDYANSTKETPAKVGLVFDGTNLALINNSSGCWVKMNRKFSNKKFYKLMMDALKLVEGQAYNFTLTPQSNGDITVYVISPYVESVNQSEITTEVVSTTPITEEVTEVLTEENSEVTNLVNDVEKEIEDFDTEPEQQTVRAVETVSSGQDW